MNKYTLKFTDQNIENDFQSSKNQLERLKKFQLVSQSLVVGFTVKAIQAVIQYNNTKMSESIIIIGYLIIQYIFVYFRQSYLRLALISMNHLISFYLFAREEKPDSYMAMLQGINQMSFSLLIPFTGEFLEGVITIINLGIFRIGWTIYKSDAVEYSALVSHLLLLYYASTFVYEFHRSRRSQFLLQFVDIFLEEILKKLSSDKPYIILSFQEENFDFIIKQFNVCNKSFKDQSLLQYTFIKNSQIKSIPLRDYLFKLIVNCRKENQNLQKQEEILLFNKKSYVVELSIYQAKDLNVLIIFQDINKNNIVRQQYQEKRIDQFGKMLMKSLSIIQKYSDQKFISQNLNRKLKILLMSERLFISKECKNIQLLKFFEKFLKHCQNVKINLLFSIPLNQKLSTYPNILSLMLLIILDNTTNDMVTINLKINQSTNLELALKGQFDVKSVQRLISINSRKFQIIFECIHLTDKLITLKHMSEIYVPFLPEKEQ